MSSSFEFYKTTIQTCLDEASSLINEASVNHSQQKLQDARQKVDQAKAATDELKREIFLLPTNDKAEAQRQFQKFVEQINRIENSFNSINRQELIGGSYDLRRAASDDHNLAIASQNFNDTIEIGHGILTNLGNQKDKLIGTMSKTDQINTSVGSTSRLVGKMMKTQRQNKLIMWAVVALLVIAIVILYYVRYF